MAVQWAYLFERFPSFTQTFCYREVAAVEQQGLAPWIFSIRRPCGEPAQDFPPGLAARVRYLPEEAELADEFRWLRRGGQWPGPLEADAPRLKHARDKARIQEAAWLGARMKAAGVGHVHAHFAGLAARTAYWLREYFGLGFSFTAHANDVFCAPEAEHSVTLEDLMRAARHVVAVSDFGAAQLRARFPGAADKIVRVYNGIDTKAFPRARPVRNGPRIVAVGRYIKKKGFGDLVAACARLREAGTAFECRIVGEGPLEGELRGAIARAGLGGSVELTGPKPISEVVELLRGARVFALPCVAEADGGMDNLPTVIAEAMACGLPVVSTTLAGVPEMVRDGRTGQLVAPGAVEGLAAALGRLLAEPRRAAAWGQAGRRRARQMFDVRVTGRTFADALYKHTAVEPPQARWRRELSRWWEKRRMKIATGKPNG